MEERIVFGKSMFQEKMDENRFGFDAQFRANAESDPLAVHKFMRREAGTQGAPRLVPVVGGPRL
ncbi:MAG: hypothetical protein IPG64_14015 [Haliea sp.]|nr:hypothetical protein [Haliea sp.]